MALPNDAQKWSHGKEAVARRIYLCEVGGQKNSIQLFEYNFSRYTARRGTAFDVCTLSMSRR